MRRMGNLSRHLGWLLLIPEPRQEARGRRSMWLFLAAGGLFVVFGVVGLLRTPPGLGEALRQWALALLLFVQALLCSPSLDGRPRAMLGARVAASVVTFAVMGVLAVTFYADGYLFGAALVAAFLVFILCYYYYFANRRRYRRSQPTTD